MNELVKHQEAISALVDGELSKHELDQTVSRMEDSSDDRLTWLAYQVTRDVMNAGPSLAGGADMAFMQRLKQSLAQEPPRTPVFPDVKLIVPHTEPARPGGLNDFQKEAANDSHFRWRWMAGLASVVMVSLVAWQAVGGLDNVPAGAQLAQGAAVAPPSRVASELTTTPSESPRMLRDPQLDALLAAHRQFGGASALQMPAGFLRNATFYGAER